MGRTLGDLGAAGVGITTGPSLLKPLGVRRPQVLSFHFLCVNPVAVERPRTLHGSFPREKAFSPPDQSPAALPLLTRKSLNCRAGWMRFLPSRQ